MSRLRFSESVPPVPEADVRRLRGLPAAWGAAIAESGVDALCRRARAAASVLAGRGLRLDAEELRRRVSLLERLDELHRHAADLETLAGLYRALEAFAPGLPPDIEAHRVWVQTGALEGRSSTAGHGPAFRETAALRNQAFRWLTAALARHARELRAQGASSFHPVPRAPGPRRA